MVQGASCRSSEKVMEKKVEKGSQMTLGEAAAAAASTLVMAFVIGLLCLYITIPDSDYTFLKLPRTLQDPQLLRDELERYTSEYTAQVLVEYCLVYIFMQTLMIPGTVFLSLLAGALFGVLKGLVLVVCTATVGASCYFLSKLVRLSENSRKPNENPNMNERSHSKTDILRHFHYLFHCCTI